MIEVTEVAAEPGSGLTGDRYRGRSQKREVTLIQAEHLSVVSALMKQEVTPDQLRRNLVISGVNLVALKGQTFEIGSARLRYTGLAHPCSRMELKLGDGGYNAMRGHGGITAMVLEGGVMRVGDTLKVVDLETEMRT